MNNILQDSLLSSMEILAEGYARQTPGTITIECDLVECLDEAIGEYKANYLGNLLKVYANNPEKKYNDGDKVFVIVPNGDFSAHKVILSASVPSTTTYDVDSIDRFLPVSDNLFDNFGTIEMCTYNNSIYNKIEEHEYEYKQLYTITLSKNFSLLFTKYLNNYKTFLFSAKIKTNIADTQQKGGNYGFILELPFKYKDSNDQYIETTKKYVLDVNHLSGNPYRLRDWTNQTMFLDLSAGEEYDNNRDASLTIFIKDFSTSDEKEKNDIRDISIKDIGFNAYYKLTDEQEKGYFLHLQASEGNYFYNDVDNKKIILPQLRVKGRKVNLSATGLKTTESYQCYWFVEDASITETNDNYVAFGGIGWRCLNEKNVYVTNKEDGSDSFEYVTNKYELEITDKDVVTSARYKCVIAVIKKSTEDIEKYTQLVSSIIHIENLTSGAKITLNSVTGSTSYVKDIGIVGLVCTLEEYKNKGKILYKWSRRSKNDEYIDNNFYQIKKQTLSDTSQSETSIHQQEISFESNIIDNFNIFTCSVYDEYYDENNDNKFTEKLIGTESIIIDVNGKKGFNLIVQNGDVLYKYDADGDSPTSDKYDGLLGSKVIIKPLSYKIYKEDGKEFTKEEYAACFTSWLVPVNSLIIPNAKEQNTPIENDYYIFHSKDLDYTISNSYNYNKIDNTILLKVKYGDNELNAAAALKFTKEGENGTNNSTYSVVITHNDAAYGVKNDDGYEQKIQLVYNVNDGFWYYYNMQEGLLTKVNDNKPQLVAQVYNGGEKITSDNIKYEWTVFDKKNTDACINLNNMQGGQNNTIFIGIDTQQKGENIGKEISWNDETSVNIVQLKVTISKTKKEEEDTLLNNVLNSEITEVYAYYPIEIIKIENLQNFQSDESLKGKYFLPTCTDGFAFVTYSSDGTNPKYNSNNIFSFNNIKNDKNIGYKFIWDASDNLIISTEGDKHQEKIRPVSTYNSEEVKNYIKTDIKINNDKKQEIQNSITKKQTLISQYKDEINEIDLLYEHNFISTCESFIKNMETQKNTIEDTYKKLLSIRKIDLIDNAFLLEKRYNELNAYYPIVNIKDNIYETLKKEFLNPSSQDPQTSTNIINISVLDKYSIDYTTIDFDDIAPTKKPKIQSLLQAYITQFDILYNAIEKFNTQNNKMLSDFNLLQDNCYKLSSVFLTAKEDDKNKILNQAISIRQLYTDIDFQLQGICSKFKDGSIITYNQIDTEIIQKMIDNVNSYIGEGKDAEVTKKIFDDEIQKREQDIQKLQEEIYLLQIALFSNVTYIRPIVMTFNRYDLAAIAGWDGSRLYTGSGNEGEYLYAPQIGAGAKETDGSFTGIVIGRRKRDFEEEIGMFGYASGEESIFLDAKTGSAFFGKSGEGQIQMIPGGTSTIAGWEINKHSLSSKSINNNQVGLYAYPAVNDEEYTHPTITTKDKITEIETTHNIAMKATDGTNEAIITYDGWFKSNYGDIGGWTIGETTLTGGNLTLDKDGKIYSNTHNNIDSQENGFYLSENGLSIGSKFYVNEYGKLIANELYADGSGSIAGWEISSNQLRYIDIEKGEENDKEIASSGISISTDGSLFGGKFEPQFEQNLLIGWTEKVGTDDTYWKIEKDGNVTFTAGTIGGWTIDKTSLKGGKQNNFYKLTLNSDGSIDGPSWSISNAGVATFSKVNSTFGGVTINAEGTYGSFGNGFSAGTSFGLTGGAKDNFETLVANKINAEYIETAVLAAGFITADTVSATYATITTLNTEIATVTGKITAAEGKIDTLESNMITTDEIEATITSTFTAGVTIIECTGTLYYQNKRIYIGTDGALYATTR